MKNLKEIIKQSTSWSQVSRQIYGYKSTTTINKLRNLVIKQNIGFSHFVNRKKLERKIKICPICKKEFITVIGTKHETTTCSYACSNTFFRTKSEKDKIWNYREQAISYYGTKCFICKETRLHVLQVHHIDKNRKNNKLDNLLVLCANCHLDRHAKENNGPLA